MAGTEGIDREKLRELLHEEILELIGEHQDTKDKLRWAESERVALAESHAELIGTAQELLNDLGLEGTGHIKERAEETLTKARKL